MFLGRVHGLTGSAAVCSKGHSIKYCELASGQDACKYHGGQAVVGVGRNIGKVKAP